MTDFERQNLARRMQATLDLFDLAEKMLRQRLRRERPEAPEAEIEEAIRYWRTTRPGAEHGDAPGRRREWPSS